jgi:hypothetical protein
LPVGAARGGSNSFLQTKERGVAEVILSGPKFDQKREWLKKVVKRLAERHPVLAGHADAVCKRLGEAKELAVDRNRFAHGSPIIDAKTKRVHFSSRDEIKDAEAPRIRALIAKAEKLFDALSTACGELLQALEDAQAH